MPNELNIPKEETHDRIADALEALATAMDSVNTNIIEEILPRIAQLEADVEELKS